MLTGYVAEFKLKEIVTSIPNVTFIQKFDDHNRKKKGDLYIVYRDRAFDLETKSLQSKTVRWDAPHERWIGLAQVDGSDRRPVRMPDGTVLNTTLLLRGEFDVLAVSCYAFTSQWDFVFARNRDLPPTSWKGYTPEQSQQLIASLVTVTWPPQPPFYDDLQQLLDEMIAEGAGTSPADLGI